MKNTHPNPLCLLKFIMTDLTLFIVPVRKWKENYFIKIIKMKKDDEINSYLILKDRYERTTATGETFNKCGKTDILLKYSKDSTN